MSETIDAMRNKFIKWKEVFESKLLKVNLGKTRVIVCGAITKDEVKRVDIKFSVDFACRKCEGNIGEAVQQ